MVPLIAGLVRRDLIYRAPVDGRSQALFLSPAGDALARDARRAIDAHEQGFRSLFDEAIASQLLDALRRIRTHG